jgi:hypothetical protein
MFIDDSVPADLSSAVWPSLPGLTDRSALLELVISDSPATLAASPEFPSPWQFDDTAVFSARSVAIDPLVFFLQWSADAPTAYQSSERHA